MGTFKHYDLRTSLEVAELNTRPNEDLGAKTKKSKMKRERERERSSAKVLERESLKSLKLGMNEKVWNGAPIYRRGLTFNKVVSSSIK